MRSVLFWLGLGSALCPVAASAAPRPAVTPPSSPAAALVQRFLDLRAAGRTTEAYALFSVADQKELRRTPAEAAEADRFLQGQKMREKRDQIMAAAPKTAAYLFLLLDRKNLMGGRSHILGATRADPRTVRVRFYWPGTPLKDITLLRLVTRPDPEAGGALRISGALTYALASSLVADDVLPAQAVSQDKLRALARAVLEYAVAHNYHYPDAERWMDEIMPYVKRSEPDMTEADLYHDPAAPDGQKWSYAFNHNLSGKALSETKVRDKVVLIFESSLDTRNATDEGQSWPAPGWHSGGVDYVAASGDLALAGAGAPHPFSP